VRLPNPRIAVPIVLGGIAGGGVGYFVTDASCAPGSCPVAAVTVALVVALCAAAGVGVVVVLAVRSFAEWRIQSDRDVLVAKDDASDRSPSGEDSP